MTLDLVEGWTGPVEFQLKADNVVVNLTGMTVELLLKGSDGVNVDTAGNITIFDAANGKVRYDPDAADLVAVKSPYLARFKVTDQVAKVVFFPNADPDVWKVKVA